MGEQKIVIALGGNAIKKADEAGTTEEQFKNVDITAKQIAEIATNGNKVIITHGNGPQAGSLLIQQEEGKNYVPPQTLAICGAMTQGQIGWMIQNRLSYHLRKKNINSTVCTVVTQVVVDENDPDFKDPTKPVGPFYSKEEAINLSKQKGYLIKEVKPVIKGWRRVVPSPEPIDVVEKDIINKLVDKGIIVIASGGGGIPVKINDDGSYSGVEAVIDKDRAGFKLAQLTNADKFVILTDVEKVYLNYNKPDQKALDTVTVKEAETLMNQDHFYKGSMLPKVQACIRFVKWSKKEAIITSLDKAADAIVGKTGTHIIP